MTVIACYLCHIGYGAITNFINSPPPTFLVWANYITLLKNIRVIILPGVWFKVSGPIGKLCYSTLVLWAVPSFL